MILVTGANGQVGTAFRSLLPDAMFLTRSQLDLRDTDSVGPALAALAPDVIINCAAYTAVDRAEEDEDTARLVNAVAVGEMARYAAAVQIPLVTYSTDYVFGGTERRPYVESSPTAPINVYGRTKLDGEELAVARHPRTLIVRSSWVISGTHPNFVGTMIDRGRKQDLKVVDDQAGSPTIADDLAAATLAALDRGATGTLHLTNAGETTWYRLARRSLEIAGLDAERIRPCTTDDFPTEALRPAYSVLGSERLEAMHIPPLPAWQASLPRVVRGQLGRLGIG